ncbi:Hydroxyacylglutathione hydrolase [Serratia symbiotica]|nr:Hydroxyacylglutathione hydrolase [Serratia symbiotica]
MTIISIPSLYKNYIWLLLNKSKHCVIIDPGDANITLKVLNNLQLTPDAILLTHHHQDHVGGVFNIIKKYSNIPVYGPQETIKKGTTHIVTNNKKFKINGRNYITISVPGHTLGHVAFYSAPYLFCGDTLFSAGCGKILEGTAKQMYNSLQKIKKLPYNTLIYCSHEYTLENLKFAHTILPKNNYIKIYKKYVEFLRKKNKPTLPTNLKLELKINLFLRCHDYNLQYQLGFNSPQKKLYLVFSKLRIKKDQF